ncbi:PEP-CTERM sorting domain-containing protein [Elioraea sp.]|uniref:PEP-CTERM sorting domain-containing protein n=1 Tax=Elioraea sp. TaxID=2185103 RepID=UPI0025BD1BD7|nr:PEP-CTERM sorting domain-containing protein [Elioraea sp.]
MTDRITTPLLVRRLAGAAALVAAFAFGTTQADAAPVTFTQITGLTGGSPAQTGVFRADLSGLGVGQIASITIRDSNSGVGGSGSQFSGFDLDALVISTVFISDASQVGLLAPAVALDFANSILTAGTQRPPADPALFGTSGGQVNNAVATLNLFDGNSTTAIPGAAGFVSLGDGGVLSINLVAPLAISSPLYLYIGEVGDNGEVAASDITISDQPVSVPEPAALLLFGIALLGLGAVVRQRAALQGALPAAAFRG